MLLDYHTHTHYCNHATGTMASYVETALARGIREMGFADHAPFMPQPWMKLAATFEEYEQYVSDVLRLRQEYPEMTLRLGCECDWVEGKEKEIETFLAAYPHDYVYGSLHFVRGFAYDMQEGIPGYQGRDLNQLWHDYFDDLARMAETKLFDILSHPDLIRKFAYQAPGDPKRFYEKTVPRIAAAGMAIEVNASGLFHFTQGPYPTLDFLRMARQAGIPLVYGSDSHAPEHVGCCAAVCQALAAEAGYTAWTRFAGRRRAGELAFG